MTKDNLRVMRRQAAGHYSPWTSVISIDKEISFYWISTFATLLHEFRHHQQRRKIFAMFFSSIITLLCLWSYGISIHSYLLIYGSAIVVIPAFSLYLYFEFDARRYVRNVFPDMLLILLILEYTLFAHSLDSTKAVRHNLSKLKIEIMNYSPHLIDNFN